MLLLLHEVLVFTLALIKDILSKFILLLRLSQYLRMAMVDFLFAFEILFNHAMVLHV